MRQMGIPVPEDPTPQQTTEPGKKPDSKQEKDEDAE